MALTDVQRKAKEEQLRRIMRERYRSDPMYWVKNRFKEDPKDFKWSLFPEYIGHEWDGDVDPIWKTWQGVADVYTAIKEGRTPDYRFFGIESCTGCHSKGTKVRMYDGTLKNVEDIVIGDNLMGDNGRPRRVLKLYRGRDIMYGVRDLKSGSKVFECNKDHILSLYNIHKGTILNISVGEYQRLCGMFSDYMTKYKSYRCIEGKITVFDFSLTILDYMDYYGFELDGNNLYLLEDYTVTHNSGKTYFLARLVCWFLDCFDDSLVVTSAPKKDQLKLNLWAEVAKISKKFKRLHNNAALYNLRLVVDDSDFNVKSEDTEDDDDFLSDSWHAIGYISGVGSEEESAGKVRGFHRKHMLIILEETPAMSRAVLTAFQNTCTGSHNVIVAVGNPDSEVDPLHQFCVKNTVSNVRISAYDYPNIVLGEEIYAGAVTQVSLDTRKEDYGEESQLYKAMARGICPSQSPDALIKMSWITQCIKELEDIEINVFDDGAAGVDVANSDSGDKACVAYGKGKILMELKEFQCPNATHLAYNLIMDTAELEANGYTDYLIPRLDDLNIESHYVGVDAVGVGAATINAFEDSRYPVIPLHGGQWVEAIPVDLSVPEKPKPMYTFASLRSQMYWEAREDFRNGEIAIVLTDKTLVEKLTKELITPKFLLNGSTITVERKEDIKKRIGHSPNMADAVVYWNWVRKGYRVNKMDAMPLKGAGK